MVASSLKERLKDLAYLDLHLAAFSAIGAVQAFPWYDAHFLQMYEAARRYLKTIRPDALDRFEAGFDPLRTPQDFTVAQVSDLFAPNVLGKIRDAVSSLPAAQVEFHETKSLGRKVVHASVLLP